MPFASEHALVTLFVARLSARASPWGDVSTAREFYYQRGRTDIVACTQDHLIIAIEAKLQDWRTALHQAFRNRCFAHQSYVLLPKATAMRAHRYIGEFQRRLVGLCYLDDVEIVLLQDAVLAEPVEPWLSSQARIHIQSAGAAQ